MLFINWTHTSLQASLHGVCVVPATVRSVVPAHAPRARSFCALSPSSVHTHARRSHAPAQDNDATAKVASGGSFLSGIIVAIGWYVFLDALVQARTQCITWTAGDTFNPSNCTEVHQNPNLVAPPGLVSGTYWVPGILGTGGVVMLNLISWEAVTDDSAFGDGVSAKAKMFVFVALVLMFCSLGGAIWVLVSDLQFKGKVLKDGHQLDAVCSPLELRTRRCTYAQAQPPCSHYVGSFMSQHKLLVGRFLRERVHISHTGVRLRAHLLAPVSCAATVSLWRCCSPGPVRALVRGRCPLPSRAAGRRPLGLIGKTLDTTCFTCGGTHGPS